MVTFTCLCTCAIHFETAYSLETDSFFAWWDPTMAPTLLLLSRSLEKPSRRWIIIKYHNICKHTQSLLNNMDQKPTQSKLHEWGLGTTDLNSTKHPERTSQKTQNFEHWNTTHVADGRRSNCHVTTKGNWNNQWRSN